ncbi:MAG: hypothetical protein ACK5ML_09885 [Lachnospiraceae bacterium]
MSDKYVSKEEQYDEDPSWSSLFEMAESYEDLQGNGKLRMHWKSRKS